MYQNAGLNMEKGEYVLATKWSDGDPQDHWYVGFFSKVLEGYNPPRFEVVGSKGGSPRGNGFRRAEKISAEFGRFLIENRTEIERSGKSLWWWKRTGFNSTNVRIGSVKNKSLSCTKREENI